MKDRQTLFAVTTNILQIIKIVLEEVRKEERIYRHARKRIADVLEGKEYRE